MPHFDPVQYWNPALTCDEQGKASCLLTPNDERGEFVICVVGRDRAGRAGSAIARYQMQTN